MNKGCLQHSLILLQLLFLTASCFGQDINPHTNEPGYDKYYPVNKAVRQNRIKYVIDSSEFIQPGRLNVKFYDSLGRLIGDTNQPVDKIDNPFVYQTRGDTIFRLKYNKGKTKLLCFERFVQNRKGQILSYLDCCNYYFKDDSYYVGYEEFYYDGQGRLKTRLYYFKEDYPGKVSESTLIKPAELQLNDVVNYSYTKLSNGNKLVVGKHAVGKPEWRKTDSAIYNRQNRIIRFSSFAKRGTMGELVQNNINDVAEYKYTDTTLTIISYNTYCALPLNSGYVQSVVTDKRITLIIYNENKTKKAVYGFYNSGERYLSDKYEYHYY